MKAPNLFALVCISALSACTGEIGAKGGGGGGGGDTTGVQSNLCNPNLPPPTTRVRRLTKVEIQNAMTVFLGESATSALANVDADSQPKDGYSNNDQLVVGDSFATSLNLAADTIGTQFKATVTTSNTAYDRTCFSSDAAAETCAKTFINGTGAKAFRRAIASDDVDVLFAVYKAGREVGTDGDAADRFATGLSYVVRAMVQSPDFLYLTELGDAAAANGAKTRLTPYETANALSFSVLGMPPDDGLVAAAEANQLTSADQRSAQVARLIAANPDAWAKQMRLFVPQWLGINYAKAEWQKDTSVVPLYTSGMRAALQTETDMLVADWATSGAPLVETLLTSPSTFVNSVNAPLYGVSASGSTFVKTDLDPSQRAGILTTAGFLGSFSHVAESSPVQRGKAILTQFMCQAPPPVPAMVPPLPALDKAAPTTTRARYAAHLADASCANCHAAFEPMGLAFEEYDALGSFRSQENGFPIDSSGALVDANGPEIPVANAVELAQALASHPAVMDCVARQAFRFAVGHKEGAYDMCSVQKARQRFIDSRTDMRELMGSIASSDAFVLRTVNR